MTRQVLLDILGWVAIAVVVLGGVLVSGKARQMRAAKQKKKAERIWQAAARYHEAVAESDGAAPETAQSDVEELEKCFYTEPGSDGE